MTQVGVVEAGYECFMKVFTAVLAPVLLVKPVVCDDGGSEVSWTDMK